jgi:hypothetical protein
VHEGAGVVVSSSDQRKPIDPPMTVHIRQLAGLSDMRVYAHPGRIDDVIEAFTTHCEMRGETVSATRIDATGPPMQIDGASYEVRYMSRSGKERVWTHTFLRSDPMWFSDEGELLW